MVMNASKNEKIQMNMESIGDSNKLFNSMFSSDGEPIFEEREIMNPKDRDILNKYKNGFRKAHNIIEDIKISYDLARLNRVTNNKFRFICDVREYTKMVAYVNFFCVISGENNSVNIDCDIINPKKLKDEIINKYGVKVYKEINSDDSYRDKLGALLIDGYCTDILDLEYLAHLLYEFGIKCSIDYDNNIFHFNIEHSKENNNQLKK